MEEKLKYKIRNAVEKLGLKQAREMFGDDVIKQVYIDNPLSFLNQFNNLKPVEKGDKNYYVDNGNLVLFYYYKIDQESEDGYYYLNYYRIWSFFSEVMGYSYNEVLGIMKEWLGTTYNLRGVTPKFVDYVMRFSVGNYL